MKTPQRHRSTALLLAVLLVLPLAAAILPTGPAVNPAAASNACEPSESTFVGDGENGTFGVTYRVLTFSDVGECVWSVPDGVEKVDVLVVGGGGGGGGRDWAGGGGGGGVLYGEGIAVGDPPFVPIVVGAGGAGGGTGAGEASRGSSGESSTFGDANALGGGGGGGLGWNNSYDGAGLPGGSGGGGGEHGTSALRDSEPEFTLAGAASNLTAPSGWTAFGNKGGDVLVRGSQAGSGGGGAGEPGGDVPITSSRTIDGVAFPRQAGDGGAGAEFSITGGPVVYAGGGGGATRDPGAGAICSVGGEGGGGAGACGTLVAPQAGTDGTKGLGGGGGGGQGSVGGNGGDGVVIVRYAICPAPDPYDASGGKGTTADDPIDIASAGHLLHLAATPGDWGKHFRQTANINLTGCLWNPIGFTPASGGTSASTAAFTGSYDGQLFGIEGLTIRTIAGLNDYGL